MNSSTAGAPAEAAAATRTLAFEVEGAGRVDALFDAPRGDEPPRACCVLAHGAGAGMAHPFMAALARGLASAHGLAVLRYQFPFMQRGSKRPDPPRTAQAAVRAAVEQALALAPGVPLFAGGKSFGGRMTSQAQAERALPQVRGLFFVGFPLHPAGRPGTERAEHLAAVEVPMLFLQGTRDELAPLALLRPVVERLGPRASLHVVDDADHAFHVRAASGRGDAAVRVELQQALGGWIAGFL